MYTTTLTSGSSFFSRGVPGWPPPKKSVFSGLAKLPPASSGIRQLAPGGKARAFADIVGDRLGQSEQRQFANLAETLIPFATRDSLDLLGEIYGVARIGQSSVVADLSDQNFKFYVRRGTFGDINGGNDIQVPSDIRIFTGDPNGPVYLADAMTLAAGDSSQFFSARSLLSGSAGNAPSGVFDRHNFTHYADSRFGTLLVTNSFGLVGGRETETDDDYRFRLNLKIQSSAGANEAALRFALLQIPGIQDLVFERQAGAFIVYVYGISPNVSPGLLQNVQNAINDKAAYPLTGLAVAPDLAGISLATSVEFKTGTSVEEKNLALEAAAAAAENYINNLAVGETLVVNETPIGFAMPIRRS